MSSVVPSSFPRRLWRMTVTLDLSEEALSLLRAEAERRRLSVDALIEEMVKSLSVDAASPTSAGLSFVAIGSSTSGFYAFETDEMLADGFGTD